MQGGNFSLRCKYLYLHSISLLTISANNGHSIGEDSRRCNAPTIAHWKTETIPAKLPVSGSRKPLSHDAGLAWEHF